MYKVAGGILPFQSFSQRSVGSCLLAFQVFPWCSELQGQEFGFSLICLPPSTLSLGLTYRVSCTTFHASSHRLTSMLESALCGTVWHSSPISHLSPSAASQCTVHLHCRQQLMVTPVLCREDLCAWAVCCMPEAITVGVRVVSQFRMEADAPLPFFSC